MTDEQLIENLRARTWPGDCEAAAFRIEELRARVAELEGESFAWRDKCMFQSGQMESLKEEATFLASERAEREKQEPVAWYIDGEDGREYNGTPKMSGGRTGAPLYAAPPVAAPARLTDSDNHANELRRMARKVGHPAGDVPAVMRAAADRIDELERLVAAFQRAEAGGITDEDRLDYDFLAGDEAELQCRTVKMRTAAKEHPCFGGLGDSGDGHTIKKGQRYRHDRALVDGDFWGDYRTCICCLDKWIAELNGDENEDEEAGG